MLNVTQKIEIKKKKNWKEQSQHPSLVPSGPSNSNSTMQVENLLLRNIQFCMCIGHLKQ